MDPTRSPDPEALAWLAAHLETDEAGLIEALPDEAVQAELQALRLDPAGLRLPAASPPARRPDRAARPSPGPRAPRWRPSWAYAAATLLLLAVASVVVLRQAPDVGPAAPDRAAPPAAKEVGPAPGIAQKSLPSTPTSPQEADRPPVAAQAPPPPPAATSQPADAIRAMPPAPVLIEAGGVSLDEALRIAEAARPGHPDTLGLHAAISTLREAYAQAPAARTATPARASTGRRRLAAALSSAYAAIGADAEARRWADLAQQP